MNKTWFFFVTMLILAGCNNKAELNDDMRNQNTYVPNSVANEELELQSPNIVTQNLVSSGVESAGFNNQNIVVRNPTLNEVTYEISEKLVGKYIVNDDPNEFFEIKSDGTSELSLNAFSGYATYGASEIQLTAYYSDSRTIITFNLVNGYKYTFPSSYGLSMSFFGDSDCTSFYYFDSFLQEYRIEMVKQ
jgi:hypothetical protein